MSEHQPADLPWSNYTPNSERAYYDITKERRPPPHFTNPWVSAPPSSQNQTNMAPASSGSHPLQPEYYPGSQSQGRDADPTARQIPGPRLPSISSIVNGASKTDQFVAQPDHTIASSPILRKFAIPVAEDTPGALPPIHFGATSLSKPRAKVLDEPRPESRGILPPVGNS